MLFGLTVDDDEPSPKSSVAIPSRVNESICAIDLADPDVQAYLGRFHFMLLWRVNTHEQ